MKSGIIVGIIVVLIILGAVYYLYSSGYFYSVKIEGEYVTLHTNYPIIGSSIQISYSNLTINAHGHELIDFNITLTNNNSFLTAVVYNVSVSSPFTVVSYVPNPLIIKPHASSTLTLVIQTPMMNYASPIDITIYMNKTI